MLYFHLLVQESRVFDWRSSLWRRNGKICSAKVCSSNAVLVKTRVSSGSCASFPPCCLFSHAATCSCAGTGSVTVLANSIQVKMNDCFAVVVNPDQFCNLVSCIVLQADTAEKAGGKKEMPVYAGTVLLLHHERIEY